MEATLAIGRCSWPRSRIQLTAGAEPSIDPHGSAVREQEALRAQAAAEATTGRVCDLTARWPRFGRKCPSCELRSSGRHSLPFPAALLETLDDLREHLRAVHATVGEDDEG